MEDNKYLFEARIVTEHGHEHSIRTNLIQGFESVGGMGIVDQIGEAVNNLLRLATYPRQNDYIFMEDVNEEELEALSDYLFDLRNPESEDDEDKQD